MLNQSDILQTLDMIDHQHLDIRTVTMGISLRDCAHPDIGECARRVYDKICRRAERLVATGEAIESEYGIPIVNKRISVTPAALITGGASPSRPSPWLPNAVIATTMRASPARWTPRRGSAA